MLVGQEFRPEPELRARNIILGVIRAHLNFPLISRLLFPALLVQTYFQGYLLPGGDIIISSEEVLCWLTNFRLHQLSQRII